MTYKEALYWCEQFTDNVIKVNVKGEKTPLALKAMRKCKEAISKQIPQKPTPYKGFEGKCTCCGVIFLDRSTNYCGNCGQALDWTND